MAANCRCKARHDAFNVQRFAVSFLPRFQPSEERAVVRLVGVGNNAITTDGLIRIDAFGLGQNVFNLLEHFAGALERSAGRELNIDSENALVLIGDESCRNRAAQRSPAPTITTATIPIVMIPRRTSKRDALT